MHVRSVAIPWIALALGGCGYGYGQPGYYGGADYAVGGYHPGYYPGYYPGPAYAVPYRAQRPWGADGERHGTQQQHWSPAPSPPPARAAPPPPAAANQARENRRLVDQLGFQPSR